VIAGWATPEGGEEYALAFDQGRTRRVLVLPAWFDEANKLRHQTVEIMRRLDRAGIDSFLPDLPGCNESLAPLEAQTLEGWRTGADAAAGQCRATHVLAIRAGALFAPDLPGWLFAPLGGGQLLRGMLRARTIAARESGREETRESLLETGRRAGLELGGHRLGAAMIAALENAEVPANPRQRTLAQGDIGGGSLWLRAEPAFDPDQADALAALIAGDLA